LTLVPGPEHQRTRQDRGDGSSVVYAGAQEVEKSATGVLTVKTYWPNGIGVEIERGTNPTEFYWTHLDRLGSPVAMTGLEGSVQEPLAYDAWGKRRTTDGAATPNNLDGQLDNRGYTGHEMLDQLDLVHMNGRVYDPLVARFLSGDPLLQDPGNGQSYNRYSYVLNNPTNMTDPTGFEACESDRLCWISAWRSASSADMISVISSAGRSAWQSTKQGVAKVGGQLPRVGSAMMTGAAWGVAASLPVAGTTAMVGGAGLNPLADLAALAEIAGTAFVSSGRSGLVEVIVILNEDQGKNGSDALSNNAAQNKGTNKEEGKKDGKEGESKSDGERKANPTKGESEVWQDLDNAGNGRKQSGNGSRRRYYEWDHTHNDIEVYDKNGKHQGSMDPTTGEMYKPPVDGRRIKL
jgi:RHS repeat-associated protein